MKRFYKDVTVNEEAGGWRVLLDTRGMRTASGVPQIVPTRALAEALAEEWRGQGETIDPNAFRLRDLADLAVDVAAPHRQATIAELLTYAETDTLCYRADPDEPLYRRQRATWEPLLGAIETRYDVRFERVSGVIHRAQPPETLARLRAALLADDPFSLAALRALAGLSASLAIALSAIEPGADTAALWAAAELEEHWQAELWGLDAEAETRRKHRFEAFDAAVRFAGLARA